MINQLNLLFHAAEEGYLQDSELQEYEIAIGNLKERLELYEKLRELEGKLVQRLALNLEESYPNEPPSRLQLALKQWVLVMRYCAMAMLLDDPDFLRYRLLEWLSDVIVAHNLQELENSLNGFLQRRLKKFLTGDERQLITPYLSQARTMLMEGYNSEIALHI